jgi:hypothetical protein
MVLNLLDAHRSPEGVEGLLRGARGAVPRGETGFLVSVRMITGCLPRQRRQRPDEPTSVERSTRRHRHSPGTSSGFPRKQQVTFLEQGTQTSPAPELAVITAAAT